MSAAYVLLQFGQDPFSHRFEDLESRPAFTVYVRVLACPVMDAHSCHFPLQENGQLTVSHISTTL